MTTPTEPDWLRQLRTSLQNAAEQMTHLGHIATAQGAMGWLYRGNLDNARRTLAALPADALQQVSLAAAVLANLADELAATRTDNGS